MKKVYLDSSILVSCQIDNHPFYKKTVEIINRLQKEKCQFFLSPLTIDEYLYALFKYFNKGYFKNPNKIKQSLKNIQNLNLNYIQVNWNKKAVLLIFNIIQKHNLKPRDAFHLKTARDNNIKYLATLDKDFDKIFKKGLIKKA